MKSFLTGVIVLLSLCACLVPSLSAPTTATVPNVIGLNVPQAAAALNRAGLRLGGQNAVDWDEASGLSPNTISVQSVADGLSTDPSTAVDVTVLREPNIALVYEDKELTVINLTTETIDVSGLVFMTAEGTTTSFVGSRWAEPLDAGECSQIWSAGQKGPKDTEGCTSIRSLTVDNTQEYFWAAANGVKRFKMIDNGAERAVCDAVPSDAQNSPMRCEAYVAAGEAFSEITPYIYFAYTTQAFAVINRSPDKWMATGQTTLLNYNPQLPVPGSAVLLGDPEFFGNPTIVADITQLAPEQCLLLTSDNPKAESPETCDVIAHLNLVSSIAFWLADFQIDSTTDDELRQCPAAVPDKTTVCVMPR